MYQALFFGGVITGLIIWVRDFICEMCILAFGIHHKTHEVTPSDQAYARIMDQCWGLGYSTVIGGKTIRYGTIVSSRYRCIGYSTIYKDHHNQQHIRMELWSMGDVTNTLMRTDNRRTIKYLIRYTNGHATCDVPIAEFPIKWQETILTYVASAHKATDCGLVLLITSPPGYGKSTIVAWLAELYSKSYGVTAMIGTMDGALYYVGTSAIILFDEFDTILRDGQSEHDSVKGVKCKGTFNLMCDLAHTSTSKPTIVFVSNLSFTELSKIAGADADAMFRSGRLDMIYNIEPDHSVTTIREYKKVANIPPVPRLPDPADCADSTHSQ